MRAFNQSNNSSTSTRRSRSTSSCSYCGDVDHQVTSCPHVETDWAMFQAFNIPCSDPDNWTNNPKAKATGQNSWSTQASTARWFKDPSGWSKWYRQCEKAFEKMQAKKLRDAKKANSGTTKRAKTCGFCGGVGHNRRDCAEMQALNKRFIRANNHWRQRLYNYFVEELGLGNGALVKVTKTNGWNQPRSEHVGIVTSINWDELNMFCYTESSSRGWRHSKKRVHENLQAPLAIRVIVDGKEDWLKWTATTGTNGGTHNIVNDEHGRPLADTYPYSWSSPEYHSMVSPTETPLSEEWLTQGQSECVEFITKKYSLKKLKDWEALSLLESYEQKYNLK
jgi:hypothetical protein